MKKWQSNRRGKKYPLNGIFTTVLRVDLQAELLMNFIGIIDYENVLVLAISLVLSDVSCVQCIEVVDVSSCQQSIFTEHGAKTIVNARQILGGTMTGHGVAWKNT